MKGILRNVDFHGRFNQYRCIFTKSFVNNCGWHSQMILCGRGRISLLDGTRSTMLSALLYYTILHNRSFMFCFCKLSFASVLSGGVPNWSWCFVFCTIVFIFVFNEVFLGELRSTEECGGSATERYSSRRFYYRRSGRGLPIENFDYYRTESFKNVNRSCWLKYLYTTAQYTAILKGILLVRHERIRLRVLVLEKLLWIL